jgi:hypothetical protein
MFAPLFHDGQSASTPVIRAAQIDSHPSFAGTIAARLVLNIELG